MRTVFTIGHSNHALERFVALLAAFSITAVADVRSTPYSRRNPQFNRKALQASLGEHGIEYVFLGRELGARPDDESCYVDGKVSYARLAAAPRFREGLERVREGSRRHAIALMCAEKEPLDCHRTILVARHLESPALRIEHILASGDSEPHEGTIARLIESFGLASEDLLGTDEDAAALAYRLREHKVAYRR